MGVEETRLWNHRDDLGLMQQLGAEIHAGAAPSDDECGGRRGVGTS